LTTETYNNATNEDFLKIYELEQSAERATLLNKIDDAISYHATARDNLQRIIDSNFPKGKDKGADRSSDWYNTRATLEVLKKQILQRIAELKAYKVEYETLKKKQKLNEKKKNGNISENPDDKRDRVGEKIIAPSKSPQLGAFIDKINTALISTLNIDAVHDVNLDRLPYINDNAINSIEHELQLLNFKENYIKQSQLSLDELVQRNKLISQLNSYYRSELAANRQFVSRVISVVRSASDKNTNSTKNTKDDEIPYRKIIADLQRRISDLETSNDAAQNEMAALKERWNNLVKTARRKKDQQAKNMDKQRRETTT